MFKPKKLILTAGPSISTKEIEYVNDAVRNGWNEHYADYVKKFEKEFAKYIGVKHAISTSSGTGALHLSLMALGIKPGDEVIVPDLSWVAAASVVRYCGAKPVFADIEKDSWCLDPQSFEKCISKKTKAVIPVHSYGYPCDMDKINKIAKKYGLKVLEDAAPSIGSTYNEKRTGSLSDIAAFSFQGAKIMATGEGGMVVTNNDELYERVQCLGDHGRDLNRQFWIKETGYKYKMSNIQAALGLAQLERIEIFVKKKRKIFDWYFRRLGNIEGVLFNCRRENIKSNQWMTSIVLDKDFGVDRGQLRSRLKEKLVDTRPFFYPISSFPMYKKVKSPVSYYISARGINLPSGVNLTEDHVNYIASIIRKVLQR